MVVRVFWMWYSWYSSWHKHPLYRDPFFETTKAINIRLTSSKVWIRGQGCRGQRSHSPRSEALVWETQQMYIFVFWGEGGCKGGKVEDVTVFSTFSPTLPFYNSGKAIFPRGAKFSVSSRSFSKHNSAQCIYILRDVCIEVTQCFTSTPFFFSHVPSLSQPAPTVTCHVFPLNSSAHLFPCQQNPG